MIVHMMIDIDSLANSWYYRFVFMASEPLYSLFISTNCRLIPVIVGGMLFLYRVLAKTSIFSFFKCIYGSRLKVQLLSLILPTLFSFRVSISSFFVFNFRLPLLSMVGLKRGPFCLEPSRLVSLWVRINPFILFSGN